MDAAPKKVTPDLSGQPASIERILVVDDSRLQRRILTQFLRKWGFEVAEAESGEQALSVFPEFDPDMVLSDWMMSGMTGLNLCSALRTNPGGRYFYFILLTSKSDKNEVAQGLDAGSDDFVTKPVDPNELRARIAAGDRILSMQNELSEKNLVIKKTLDRLRAAYEKIDKDLKQARKIQDSLIPERSREFGKSRVSLLLKPSGHIGGDLVGMFSPGQNRLAFYSIDVSGHGITSAMMTARLGSYLSSAYFDQNIGIKRQFRNFITLLPPAEVAKRLNQRLAADRGIDEYFTMVYATVDLSAGHVRMVQAGHPHPAVLRQSGEVEFVGEGGLPIGLFPDVDFQQIDFYLNPGDRLLLYSDGISECRTRSGDMLEGAGLVRLIQTCADNQKGQDFLDDMFWSLTQEMCPDTGLEDDVSAALLEFNGT